MMVKDVLNYAYLMMVTIYPVTFQVCSDFNPISALKAITKFTLFFLLRLNTKLHGFVETHTKLYEKSTHTKMN